MYCCRQKLCSLQNNLKLCLPFIAGLNGQPCMVLQTRYFRLLDINNLQHANITSSEVAVEVSLENYHAGKLASPEAFVCAQEVVFDSKGKRTCNLSM